LTEDAKKMNVSTQSMQTIEAFYQKYHNVPSGLEDIVAANKDLKTQLSHFVADSVEKWNWSSDKDDQKTIANLQLLCFLLASRKRQLLLTLLVKRS
jgi:hypothetical protein